ncbi:MAG: sialate O-acetylesterase [Pirellulaceae bacterium]|jgi:hypothetical protein
MWQRSVWLGWALLFATGSPSPGSAQTAVAEEKRPLVFVITGESNSGGVGLNSDATPAERQPRSSVVILDLEAEGMPLVPMQLGKNNLRKHVGLENYYDKYHGLENGLANAVEGGVLRDRSSVYLVKTGHGGSTIAQWQPDAPTGYWRQFVERTEAVKRQLDRDAEWVVWMSLGINDAIAGTDPDLWQRHVGEHLARIQNQLPGARVVMTEFQSMGYPETNLRIRRLADELQGVESVETTGVPLSDANHWGYEGLKQVADRMLKKSFLNDR